MAYTKYSLTPANNNATPPDGAPEGMLPSAVNDTMRDMMAQIRDCGDGIRDGTYTMTAPKITGGTITGAAFTGNTFTSPVISGGTINNAVIGGSTPAAGTFTSLSDSGNLTFTGTGNRITGDFSNATIANRVAFQTSTTNGNTGVGIIPNGTSTTSSIRPYNNSDPTNAGTLDLAALVTDMRISSAIAGTGTYVPLTFYTGGSERLRIETDGDVSIGTSTQVGGVRFTVVGGGIQLSGGTTAQEGVRIQRASGVASFTGINNDNNAYNALSFATSATEAMRIDTSGNVGIGTSSPSTYGKFVVNGASNADAGIFIGNQSLTGSAPTYKGTVRIIDNPTSSTGTSGGLEFLTSTFGSGYGWKIASIDSSGVQLTFATRQNSASWTEAMRIDSSGRLLVGTTAVTTSSGQSGEIYSTGATGFMMTNSTAANYALAVKNEGTSGTRNLINFYEGSAGGTARANVSFDSSANTFIKTSGATDLLLGTNNTERMRIDSSGNVGIGETSIAGTANYTQLVIRGTSGAELSLKGGSTQYGYVYVDNGGFRIINPQSGSASGTLQFHTSNTERMRITSGGDLLVGTTTSQGEKATFQSATISSANIGIVQIRSTKTSDSGDCALAIVKNANDSTTAQVFVRFGINGYASGSGQINANGASAAAFGSFSDIRLKENITDLPSQLANITALRPVEFDYKDGSGHQIGFIAQEMQKVYPDVVSESNDGMLMLTGWSKTEARLVKAIQEQQAMIEELKQEVALLKSK